MRLCIGILIGLLSLSICYTADLHQAYCHLMGQASAAIAVIIMFGGTK